MRYLLLLMALAVSPVYALDLVLKFTLPTEREDNTPLNIDELAFCQFYVNGQPGDKIEQFTGPQVRHDMTVNEPGRRVYTVRCVDTLGQQSTDSNLFTLNISSPKPVTDLGAERVEN